jgi:hypothetical protein
MPCCACVHVVVGGALFWVYRLFLIALHACASDNQAWRVGLGLGPPAMGIGLGSGEIPACVPTVWACELWLWSGTVQAPLRTCLTVQWACMLPIVIQS